MFGNNVRTRVAALALAGITAVGVVASACGGDDGNDAAKPTAKVTSSAVASPTAKAGSTPTTGAGTTPTNGGGIPIIAAKEVGTLGVILTTIDGYTLYQFANDVAGDGKSACEGACAQTWQPLPVVGEPAGGDGVTGKLDTITRGDGMVQVTYKGKPLYLFSGDAAPGDTNGKAIANWSVVKP